MLKSIAATCNLGRVKIHPLRKVHMGSARWWKWCETNYISAGVLILMFTFIMGSMLLNAHSNAGIWQRVRGIACRVIYTELFANPLLVHKLLLPLYGVRSPNLSQCRLAAFCKQMDDEFAVNSECRQAGEALPRGFMAATSDLSLRSLGKNMEAKIQREMPRYLLAMPVGVKQKKIVDQIVQKFPLQNFTIMLFHYDGVVDQWSDLPWSTQCIHIVALHQTKWWYAKRFLHPDIVEEYNYIFLWDEDLGVEHFDPIRYVDIMKEEGLEISQPALDPDSLSIHHDITRRIPHERVHRRVMSPRRPSGCTVKDNGPPCTGWVEVMAPVFSKSAWRCTWYLIQNDLIHGWGLDMKLGYCVQGKRSELVGVIDEEYIVHKGIPTLRKGHHIKKGVNTTESGRKPVSKPGVRRRPAEEIGIMARRWEEAISNDPSWVDPYSNSSIGMWSTSVGPSL